MTKCVSPSFLPNSMYSSTVFAYNVIIFGVDEIDPEDVGNSLICKKDKLLIYSETIVALLITDVFSLTYFAIFRASVCKFPSSVENKKNPDNIKRPTVKNIKNIFRRGILLEM